MQSTKLNIPNVSHQGACDATTFVAHRQGLIALKQTLTDEQIGLVWEMQEEMLASFAAVTRADLEAADGPEAFAMLVHEATKLVRKELPLRDGIDEAFGEEWKKHDQVLDWLEPQIPWFLLTRLGQPNYVLED